MSPPMKGSENPKRLDGKVVVITGANTGIGKETAKDLCKRGARVIILCRSEVRAKKAIEDIKTQVAEAKIEFEHLDLASLQSVRACAARLVQKEDKIDILVNNAGVFCTPFTKTVDGFELQFATNHLGHFLLTEQLLPLIRRSAETGFHPRIVIVSSGGHAGGSINWEDVNLEAGYGRLKAYNQSKLANVLHAKELARRLKGSGISVYVLNPGLVKTEVVRYLKQKWYAKIALPLLMSFALDELQGAQTTLYCALEDSIENASGKYYDKCAEKSPHPRALSEKDQKKLWEVTEKMVGVNE